MITIGLMAAAAPFTASADELEDHGFKKYPLKEGHMKRVAALKAPTHKFIPVKKANGDQSWLYVDPVQCKCYYYGDDASVSSYKDRSWGDKVANYDYFHGAAMSQALWNEPGQGVPLGLTQ